VNVSVLPDEPATTDAGSTVMVPVPSAALVKVTLGDMATTVKPPPAVDFSDVVKVETPADAGAVAPEPPAPFDPNTMVQVPPLVSVTPVTVMVRADSPTTPHVDVV
jgi:hypothetical protein